MVAFVKGLLKACDKRVGVKFLRITFIGKTLSSTNWKFTDNLSSDGVLRTTLYDYSNCYGAVSTTTWRASKGEGVEREVRDSESERDNGGACERVTW